MFLSAMQWRKSLDSASPGSKRLRRPLISSVDGTNANQWIGLTMLRSNHRPRRLVAPIRLHNFFHPRTLMFTRIARTILYRPNNPARDLVCDTWFLHWA
ncbi:hypothetical protein Pla52o_50020 [Novipirellula galeiformis]|uniref:Uncharacterized protein n=1 Tax=Novipirellula galeiformis TaxID=2528004 RepID=A0A5C6C1E3_9BACT|nr:hypothetical protein Pla52o_50020 [Novipirellula galeiformis]